MPFDFERYGGLIPRERVAQLIDAAEPQVRPEWQSLYEGARELIDTAYATAPDAGGTGSGLEQIEHVVVLINENRSFDHYFGTLSSVRGFDDPAGQTALKQAFPQAGGPGFRHPFRLDPSRTIHDPSHSWAAQHACWNGGAMDQWITTHLGTDGTGFGALSMGYYDGPDLPIHHALADAFTLCDDYHCSVLGPTDPNRLFAMTGTIDPDGWHHGPMLDTEFPVRTGAFGWKTYPECLQDAGKTWKIYQDRTLGALCEALLGGMMDWFAAYRPWNDLDGDLRSRAFDQRFPDDFVHDIRSGNLPAVSWIIPSVLECEHPTFPPTLGAVGIMRVIQALIADPEVWAHTVVFVTYDENGGFFDHVPPLTSPEGTDGEWVNATVAGRHGGADTHGIGVAGPIGLGFRVPCLIISPFSRGGLVATDLFDHTSLLRFMERVFGVSVPDRDPATRSAGLSAWRRANVGDLTTAFDFGTAKPTTPPTLPTIAAPDFSAYAGQVAAFVRAQVGGLPPYPLPPDQVPHQAAGPSRRHVGAGTA